MTTTAIRLKSQTAEPAGHFKAELVAIRPVLHARAMFLARSADAADDLVQETMERALRNARRFAPGTNMVAWLTTIMRNLFSDKLRHATCERRFVPREEYAPAASSPGPWDVLTLDDVKAVLPSLAPLYRRPFEMIHFEKRSLREVSQGLGIPISTVGTRTFRARLMVRRLLLQRHPAANNNALVADDLAVPGLAPWRREPARAAAG